MNRLLSFLSRPLLLPYFNQLSQQCLHDVIPVLKFETFYFLQVIDLDHIRILLNVQALGLKVQQLFALFEEHILLLCDQVVFGGELEVRLFLLKLDCVLHES